MNSPVRVTIPDYNEATSSTSMENANHNPTQVSN